MISALLGWLVWGAPLVGAIVLGESKRFFLIIYPEVDLGPSSFG